MNLATAKKRHITVKKKKKKSVKLKSYAEIQVSLLRLLKRHNLRRPRRTSIETVKASRLWNFFPPFPGTKSTLNGPPRHGHWEKFIEVFPNWPPQTRLNSVSTLGKRWPRVAREAGAVRHRRTKRSTPPVCVHQSTELPEAGFTYF